MTGVEEQERTSICTTPTAPPHSFHYFSVDANVWREINAAADASARTPVEAALMVGEVLAILRLAARGELELGEETFEPVRRDPDLWELKWKFKGGRLFRMYHAEPGSAPALVALRFHRKEIENRSADEVRRLQNDEMDLAATRYATHAPARWGHLKGCTNCLQA